MPVPHKSESDTAAKVTESVLSNFREDSRCDCPSAALLGIGFLSRRIVSLSRTSEHRTLPTHPGRISRAKRTGGAPYRRMDVTIDGERKR
jgi:hypothetical protein